MAALTLSPLFSDHAVLQRDAPLPIWGTAAPGATVTVALSGQTQSTPAAPDGRWRVTLAPQPAGGPHTLTVASDGDTLTRTGLHIGEVWLCSGQSNMQWTVAQCVDAGEESAAAVNYPRLRLFFVPKDGQPGESRRDFAAPAQWSPCTPDAVRNFSSLAYHFGRDLHDAPALSGVAIGLIDCSFGGTKVEAWMSREFVAKHFPDETLRDSFLGFPPSGMYNAMFSPVVPFAVRGVLWYQGESNASHPEQYGRLLPGMIAEWRERLERPAMPFILVQLPNWAERLEDLHYTWLREQQARVAAADPNVHMAVTIDAGDDYDLHPIDKRPIAHRLALLARAKVYSEAIAADSPVYQSHEVVGDSVRVRFSHAAGGLVNANAGGPLRGFAIAGADGLFRYAEAAIEGDSVIVRHPAVAQPRHVRYAWEGAPPGVDLYNAAGLPAAPFRTDDFPPDRLDVYRLPTPRQVRAPRYEALIDGNGCMTSLKIAGQEFIDGTNPVIPGTFFKSGFGAVRLHHITVEGPRLMRAEMYNARTRFEFRDDGMTWVVENLLDQEMPYCMILSSTIESAQFGGQAKPQPMPAEGEFATVALRQGEAVLEISGAGGRLLKAFSEPSPLPALEWSLGPKESRQIEFKMK